MTKRLNQFKHEMYDKFVEVDGKHQGESVLDDNIDWDSFNWNAIESHFWEEVEELRQSNHDSKECIDVANMAFLLWWRYNQTK